MTKKRGFTLVELLVVIAIIAVLLAVLMPALRYAKSMAQRIQCSTKLKGVATAFSLYVDEYNGNMPTLERKGTAPLNRPFTYHYYVYRREDPTGSGVYPWYGMGCLFAAKRIENPLNFYCPATDGWRDEYNQYNNPAPWGTLPQNINDPTKTPGANGNQWIRVKKGYIYWPQSKEVITALAPPVAGEEAEIYSVGYPQTPVKFTDLNQGKSLASDFTWHMVKGSGYSINVVFPDTHVTLSKVPKADDGRYWVFSGLIVPDDVPAANQLTVKLAEYMFALQP